MLKMQTWQWAVVAIVALGCVGAMSFTVARMFSRKANAPAVLRQATAFESAAVGSGAPASAVAHDGFSYRVPGRFAGRVRIVVADGKVSIAGPRMPSALYQLWIWIQAIMLALVPAAAVAALVRLDLRWLWATLAMVLVWFAFSSLGAVAWPGMGEMDWLAEGRFKAVEFPVGSVHDVKIGAGWADGGIDAVLLPIKGGIDAMSKDHAVSFTAPDENGLDVRYAIHIPQAADATALAAALE
jgi:hypothetical protein